MPLHLVLGVAANGLPPVVSDNLRPILTTLLAVTLLSLVKLYTGGRANPAVERPLHGKVVILTGGTSGIGAQVARQLASRGAQLVLLTQTSPADDAFLEDYVADLRRDTKNQMIYAEQVDLRSLHSVRRFATKWIDNAPPRRLDMVVLCAATLTPPGGPRRADPEGVEDAWMVNFLANFHLLGILSPALRAQPFDRDVRILIPTCSAYIGAPSLRLPVSAATWSPSAAYARSKLALTVFGTAFQKHLDAYKRPDELPMNARVIFVDPGLARTPGTRRWLTRGSLWGLALYLLAYPLPWLLLKSPAMAAQSFLFAAMDGSLGRGPGGRLIKECMEVDFARSEVRDEEVAKKLWEESDALIERVEKAQAKRRAMEKGREAEKAKQDELEGLVDAIKKGKEKQKQNKKGAKGKKGNTTAAAS